PPERLTPLLPLVPNPQAFTLKRLERPQQLPHTQNRALARPERERRIGLSPLFALTTMGSSVSRQLHVQHVRVITRQGGLTPKPEHLARIRRTRRRAHQQDKTIRRGIRRRNHVLHGLLGKDLRLIQHENIDLSETAPKAI